jgi:hypothetical protein
MLGVAIACGRFLAVFHTVYLLSISCRNWLYSVEQIETGETVDSENRQQTCGFGANRMKSKWGRSSVG